MKFGTLVRVKDVKECGAAFEKLNKAGFESCQLVYKPDKYDVEDAYIIKDAAEKNGIEISAFFAGYKDDYTAWDLRYDYLNAGLNSAAFGAERLGYLLGSLPFIRALGTADMIIHAGFVPNDPFAEKYADMVCKIKLLAERAKNYGLNVLFETGGESPITLLRLIREVNTGNLFVNLDTGNLITYGYGNPCDAVMTFGRYVRNVHAKDGLPPTDPYKLGEEMPLGKGVVDFKRVFSLLKERGYDRFITIEREIEGEEQARDILSGLDYLKKILKEI
ncbi:MAG TPA: xylose isomerase [Clostridiales bacterium]|nr:xylose isomerase [Clostridiales bacterium]